MVLRPPRIVFAPPSSAPKSYVRPAPLRLLSEPLPVPRSNVAVVLPRQLLALVALLNRKLPEVGPSESVPLKPAMLPLSVNTEVLLTLTFPLPIHEPLET